MRVQSIIVGLSGSKELEKVIVHIAFVVKKWRAGMLLSLSSLNPLIQSRLSAQGMLPPTMGRSSHLSQSSQEPSTGIWRNPLPGDSKTHQIDN